MSDVRFPDDADGANNFMNRTDDDQKSIITPPDIKKCTIYGWKPAESDAWTDFRERINVIHALYSNPDTTGPGVREKMRLIISEIRAYDNDKDHGHHLLDKVALTGSVDDCLTFNVVRGTALAAEPVHHDYSVVTLIPSISIKKNEIGFHVIGVVNPATPDSVAIPDGISMVRVYRFIGTEKPKSLRDFDFLGLAKRGQIKSMFTGLEFDSEKRQYAYYYAVYENKDGVTGPTSAILKVEIRLEVIPT